MVGRQQSAGIASTRGPYTIARYCSFLFATFWKKLIGTGHRVLGTFPAPKPAACGEHTSASNHHSTQRDHFSGASIMHG